MRRVLLESETLASALYVPQRRQLELEFRSGERYLYFQVPLQCYRELLEAESKGAYFNRAIRDRFPFEKVSARRRGPIVLPGTKRR
jgi:hypothetical protein